MLQLIQVKSFECQPAMASPKSSTKAVKDMRAEYHFDYGKARPNRFAGKVEPAAVVVVLDPDVTEVLKSPRPRHCERFLRSNLTARHTDRAKWDSYH